MFDADTMHNLCRLRSTLEAFAVERWRARPDRAEISKRLRGGLRRLRAAAAAGDLESFNAIDAGFHRALIEAAGVPALIRCWEETSDDMTAWLRRVQQVYWPNLMDLYREHEMLMDAWESPDDWVAENATHRHIESGWYRMAAAAKTHAPELGPVERAAAFMSTHFASRIDVGRLARHVSHLSAVHLSRRFKQHLGVSPSEFLRRIRLDRAAEQLRSTSEAVSIVARRVGFPNASHFVRAFRARFGVTPLAYRRSAADRPRVPRMEESA